MFYELFQLCKRHEGVGMTPIEDFTTEAFAGILRNNDVVRKIFFKHLDLPINEPYKIETQEPYKLMLDNNCRIDIVIKVADIICFIENKVNSYEQNNQLERYCKVLDSFKGKKTKLVYCTKYNDPKSIKKHNFQHIRWYQIAKFLYPQSDKPLVNSFIKFLKKYKMAQDLTLTISDFQLMDNFQHTLSIFRDHLDNAKADFDDLLIGDNKSNRPKLENEIKNYNRYIYQVKNILEGDENSDFNYGFYFNKPSLYVGIYVGRSNKFYSNIISRKNILEKEFEVIIKDSGVVINLEIALSTFLNDKLGDEKILAWFKNAFQTFHFLFKSLKDIKWKKIKVD